ncbi:hypothetical protein E2C01_046062 [Portunus trituberculatus]|uniref:Uncharacterized protein n=1 Tax=Portunus trituberculatus TaxID=210409 RepID=A0A5B7G3S5_PORTR|nr:hypothetical protein [Portunus trituberculatus]
MTSALTAPVRGCEVARPLMVGAARRRHHPAVLPAWPAAHRPSPPRAALREAHHTRPAALALPLLSDIHNPGQDKPLAARGLGDPVCVAPPRAARWPRPRRSAPPLRHSPAFTADLKFLRSPSSLRLPPVTSRRPCDTLRVEGQGEGVSGGQRCSRPCCGPDKAIIRCPVFPASHHALAPPLTKRRTRFPAQTRLSVSMCWVVEVVFVVFPPLALRRWCQGSEVPSQGASLVWKHRSFPPLVAAASLKETQVKFVSFC